MPPPRPSPAADENRPARANVNTAVNAAVNSAASTSAGAHARAQPPGHPALPASDALLRRLEWQVIRRLDGLLQGDHRTLLRGAGLDLADLREYQPHDDVRHIDWNVTARLDAPYVRQFVEDRDLAAWFLVDRSASIDFGSVDATKLDVVTGFVATLARVLSRHGNRVGALLYRQGVDTVLPPAASRTHVLHLIERLRRPAPQAAPARPRAPSAPGARAASPVPPAGTVLGELLGAAEGLIQRRSLVFVLSDFISAPGWEAPLARLARRHDVVVVRVFDPLELALPDLGLVTVEDAETGERLRIDAGDAAFRARYEALAAEQEEALRRALAASGADAIELATDDDLLDALLRTADLRRQRARRPQPLRLPAHLVRAQPA